MIFGAHFLFYSTNPEADRAFFRDVLGFHSVDAGEGWLIFAMPPTEAGVHPSEVAFTQTHAGHSLLGAVLYLMCDDLQASIASLKSQRTECSEVVTAGWGLTTTFALPSGGRIGLYQPRHPIAVKPA
jgi:catechol 2,3-dioxygenase-like lactoylglutathione lyase family enzyme